MSDKANTKHRSNNNERLIALLSLMVDGEVSLGEKPDLREIQDWHLGKLDKVRAEQVRSHVARDPECYQIWSELIIEERTASADNRRYEYDSIMSVIINWIRKIWNRPGQSWLAGGLVTALLAVFAIILIPQQDAWSPMDDPVRAELAYDWPYAGMSITRGGVLEYRSKIALQAGLRAGIALTTSAKQEWGQAIQQLPELALSCDKATDRNDCIKKTQILKKVGIYAGVLYLACLDYTQSQQQFFNNAYWKNLTEAWHELQFQTEKYQLKPLQTKIVQIGKSKNKQQQCELVRDVIFMSY